MNPPEEAQVQCPACEGAGCRHCARTGRIDESEVEGLIQVLEDAEAEWEVLEARVDWEAEREHVGTVLPCW